jgi:hypothetical protein
MRKKFLGGLLTLLLLLLSTLPAQADYVINVSVNTSGLSGNYTAPFGIDFELLSGGAASGNTAVISNINLGGGSPVGTPGNLFGTGISTGDLGTSVTLGTSPSLGFADFNQGFTPGSTLSFKVDLSTNPGSTPDSFSFYILESYSLNNGTPILTTDALASSLVSVDLSSSTPAAQAYAGVNGVPPLPSVTPLTSVPEPASLTLFAIGLVGLAAGRRRQRSGVAA